MLKAEDVIRLIDEGYDAEKPRRISTSIGASAIGNKCDAYLAFSLRGFPETEPTPKLKRIFRLGHVMEDMVVEDLKKKADIRVFEKDEWTGDQHRFELLNGHVVCKLDGMCLLDEGNSDELSGLEIKTMNQTSWNKFVKHGVEKSHDYYYAQLQMMMGVSGLRQFLFIAICKNTSEYHAEIVEFDELAWSAMEARIERVLNGDAPKVAKGPEDWRCRGCFKHGACWGTQEVEPACTRCVYSRPVADGGWHCTLHNEVCDEPCEMFEKWKPEGA